MSTVATAPAPEDPKTNKQIGSKPKPKKPIALKVPYRHPAYYAKQRPLDGDGDDAA